MSKLLAQALFPDVKSIPEIIAQYPARPQGQIITRTAPSPTGFLHVGNLYNALFNERIAHQSGGTFLLRVEDTDQTRNTTNYEEQSWGTFLIIEWLASFGIYHDEGSALEVINWKKNIIASGNYGPYIQSERLSIYNSFVAYLLETDQAYVCFMTPQEIEQTKASQELTKQATWIYWAYALSRNLSDEVILEKIAQWKEYVIRRKSNNKPGEKVSFNDGIRGNITMEANYADQIILKSYGFPSYALAHVVDDYLMGTTHVIRSDERLPSVPYHIELYSWFKEFYTKPKRSYNHTSPIQKLDNGSRRKLSKRKDPESDVQILLNRWLPAEWIKVYIMSLFNTNFEDRRKENNQKHYTSYKEFQISFDKCNAAGAIFDIDKLHHICAEYLAIVPLDQLYEELLTFYKHTDQLQIDFDANVNFIKAILSFDRNKKLHTTYQDIINYIIPFLSIELQIDYNLYPEVFSRDLLKQISSTYSDYISSSLFNVNNELLRSKEEWFEDLKQFGKQFGVAANNAEFKEGGYIAKIGDLAMILRVSLYGSTNTPDIYEMIRVMWKDKVLSRLQQAAS